MINNKFIINNLKYYINILFFNGLFLKIKIHKKLKKFYNIKYYLKKKKKIKNIKKKINSKALSPFISNLYTLILYIKNKNIYLYNKYIKLNLNFINSFSLINNINILLILDNRTFLFIKETFKNIKSNIYIINNFFFKIYLKKKSNVIYLKYKKNNFSISTINNIIIYQKKFTKFILYDINLYEKFNYNNIIINNLSNYCLSRINSIIISSNTQTTNFYLLINNNYSYCNNKQYYIGIYDDSSKSILKGLINVKKNTKNNISYQNYKNFILSNKVYINLKPYLNIYTNNIKCSHGVNIGKINKFFIYYLQSRGIKLYKAKILFFLSILYKIINIKTFKCLFKDIKNKLKLILNKKKFYV
ncbi:MAG: SufD family Fe-S cluster assembly protein [Candidatus Shikimatogenerans bostrichidophilus]|nr:MAG: SufD family Fe-S cluster assembly protein [Candidatus Shikimatogenerans bostrichidophilus]